MTGPGRISGSGSGSAPVRAGDRVVLLDALRGFALLGIMFVNMTWFTGFAVRPPLLPPDELAALPLQTADAIVAWVVHFAVDSKFWSIFALLFGVGFAIQAARPAASDAAFARLYTRRMIVLLAIGLAHAVLLWFGDIVSIYAAVGLCLLLFRQCSPRTLLVWAAVLLLSPILINAVWLAVDAATYTGPPGRDDPGHGPLELLPLFGTGTYVQVLEANWAFLVERWWIAVYSGRYPALLGMFLLGAWAGRTGVFREPGRHAKLIWSVLGLGLLVGVPANAVLASVSVQLRPPSPAGWVMTVVGTIGIPALCLAWTAAATLVLARGGSRLLLVPLASVGRMSLTNYVAQSVVGIAIFYGYGLGQWLTVGITWSLALIAAIFAGQALVSAWWLRRFEQGPLEWLWRCATYGRLLPLRSRRRPGGRVSLSG